MQQLTGREPHSHAVPCLLILRTGILLSDSRNVRVHGLCVCMLSLKANLNLFHFP